MTNDTQVTRNEALAAGATAALEQLLSAAGWVPASAPPVDEDDPGRFHALFGRDALITALQVLPARPDVARATLRALAWLQGRREDAETEEQPGRILHEDRPVAPAWLVDRGWPVREGALRYFGSSDATSWFLVLLDTTGDDDLQRELAPAREAAADWLTGAIDAGGGWVRCGPRRFPGGLAQQGWRDALDPTDDPHGGGIVRADGTLPAAPLADVDSQAVAVAALDALVRLDPPQALRWQAAATALRARLETHVGPEVMALEADGRVVPGAGSQLGWLLWADALAPESAARVAARLSEPDLLTAYGVRTLAATHPVFRADAYHRGAVWPFDSWLCWGGLRRAGRLDAADRVREGVLRAVDRLGHHPELYAVDATGGLRPVPVANRVQAWTVGAVLALDREWNGRVS